MLLNKSRAERIMEKNGLEALVATTPENVAYLTGFWVLTSLRHRGRQVFAVICKKEMVPDMVISRGLVDHPLQGNTWVRHFYLYGEFYFAREDRSGLDDESRRLFQILHRLPNHKNALEALIQCLKDNGIHQGRIGVDQGSDVVFLGNALEKHLPGLKTKPAYDLFREIRTLKTPEEVLRIRRATEVAENALSAAIQAIGEGVSEKELDLIFKEAVVRQGGIPTLACIGSGPRGAFPNVEPSQRRISKGDLVRFDVGCLFQAYHTDIARTAVLGPPNGKQKNYHDALVAGQGRILEALKPGARISDLFMMGMTETKEKGIPHYQRHHLGHGTGIEGYDLPIIGPDHVSELEQGMVLCVETPYYEPGFGGLQIEDIVEITAGGCQRLTRLERKLFIV
jgi:Xaa-Pro aminopeptidase